MYEGTEKASQGIQKTGEMLQEGVQKGGEKTMGDQPEKMIEQSKGMVQMIREKLPLNRKQVMGLITILIGGTVLLVGGGLAFIGTIITFILATPLLLLASPVLIPIGITLFVATAGLLTAGATALVFVSVLSWIYRHFRGQPSAPRKDELEYARQKLMETASQLQERTREYGSNVTEMLQSNSRERAASGA